MNATPRTRSQMRNYSTAYEIVAVLPSGNPKSSLLTMARRHADALLPLISDDDMASYSARDGLRLGKNVVIRKSGLTERECAA